MEITAQELQKLNKDSYQLIDIRNEEEAAYGEMAGALRIPTEEIMQAVSGLDCTKKLVICCARGSGSQAIPCAFSVPPKPSDRC